MKKQLFLLLFLPLITACLDSTSTSPKVVYEFPEKTVISNIDNDPCLQKTSSKFLAKGKQLDDSLLDRFSDEVPVKKEKEVGRDFFDSIKKEFDLVHDNRSETLEHILDKMQRYVSRSQLNYQIHLIQDDQTANAWTHAGGYIYVTTKLMDFVDSEDELAVIIGHEIGHNENKHVAKHLQRANIVKGIGDFFGLEVEDETSETIGGIFNMILTPYNQPQEHESDRAGLYLAYKAGYDPVKGLDFFDRLNQHQNESWLKEFLMSHPHPDERLSCMRGYLDSSRKTK